MTFLLHYQLSASERMEGEVVLGYMFLLKTLRGNNSYVPTRRERNHGILCHRYLGEAEARLSDIERLPHDETEFRLRWRS